MTVGLIFGDVFYFRANFGPVFFTVGLLRVRIYFSSATASFSLQGRTSLFGPKSDYKLNVEFGPGSSLYFRVRALQLGLFPTLIPSSSGMCCKSLDSKVSVEFSFNCISCPIFALTLSHRAMNKYKRVMS